MSRNEDGDLRAAFELISEFKEGGIQPGADITAQQFRLLKLLRADLLPNEPDLDGDLHNLVLRMAKEDTHWNHKTMEVVNTIYSMRSAGKASQANLLKQTFLGGCPSRWYRDIVDAV